MDITKLTAEQRAELKAQLEAEERAEKQKRQDDIDAYKQSVDEFVRTTFDRLKRVSELMREEKNTAFTAADTIIALKDELYDTKTDRHSNSFTSSDGMVSITLGRRTNDGWDDTVNVGVQKVHDFFKSMARDEEMAALTEMVMSVSISFLAPPSSWYRGTPKRLPSRSYSAMSTAALAEVFFRMQECSLVCRPSISSTSMPTRLGAMKS